MAGTAREYAEKGEGEQLKKASSQAAFCGSCHPCFVFHIDFAEDGADTEAGRRESNFQIE